MADYIIGDLHGCHDKLVKALDIVKFDKSKDNLYFVGDLCDRGKENLKTLRFAYSLGEAFKPVFGNHDVWLYEYFAFGNENECWIGWNGGDATMAEVKSISAADKKKYAAWLSTFPYMRDVGGNVVCHNFIRNSMLKDRIGDFDPCKVTLGNCRDSGLVRHPDYDEYVFDREIAEYIQHKAGQKEYRWYPYHDDDFKADFPEGKNCIMGHTPLYEHGMAVYGGVYMIDTGAFVTKKEYRTAKDGCLTIMDLGTKNTWTI
ncbi:MAG TPA: hypothetical protein DCO86_03965 [Spirochaetaceae bacterium]|nr:hypothetical protein [Spirochaetaceae bacterium]